MKKSKRFKEEDYLDAAMNQEPSDPQEVPVPQANASTIPIDPLAPPAPGMVPVGWMWPQQSAVASAMDTGDTEVAGLAPDGDALADDSEEDVTPDSEDDDFKESIRKRRMRRMKKFREEDMEPVEPEDMDLDMPPEDDDMDAEVDGGMDEEDEFLDELGDIAVDINDLFQDAGGDLSDVIPEDDDMDGDMDDLGDEDDFDAEDDFDGEDEELSAEDAQVVKEYHLWKKKRQREKALRKKLNYKKEKTRRKERDLRARKSLNRRSSSPMYTAKLKRESAIDKDSTMKTKGIKYPAGTREQKENVLESRRKERIHIRKSPIKERQLRARRRRLAKSRRESLYGTVDVDKLDKDMGFDSVQSVIDSLGKSKIKESKGLDQKFLDRYNEKKQLNWKKLLDDGLLG